MKVIALSSSRMGNSTYLETALPYIGELAKQQKTTVAFIPFADASGNYDLYTQMVQNALMQFAFNIQTVLPGNARQVVEQADIIMVGGGNTFKLLHHMYAYQLLDLVKQKVRSGTPYVGWSAGANLTGATISTTNDMPVIQPVSFAALGFFPFHINPHYRNETAPGFHGETRDQRLFEFLEVNPAQKVVALPEGSALILDDESLTYRGSTAACLFEGQPAGPAKSAIEPGALLDHLL